MTKVYSKNDEQLLQINDAFEILLDRLARTMALAHQEDNFQAAGEAARDYSKVAFKYEHDQDDAVKAKFLAEEWSDLFDLNEADKVEEKDYVSYETTGDDDAPSYERGVRGIVWHEDMTGSRSIVEIVEAGTHQAVVDEIARLGYGDLPVQNRGTEA